MIIKYRSHTFTVADCDLIVMGDNFYAKVNIGKRGNDAWHYIKVAPPIPQNFDSGLLYDQPQPCTAVTIWRPTVELPITQLGYYREGSKQKAIPGMSLNMSNVRIVLTLPSELAAA